MTRRVLLFTWALILASCCYAQNTSTSGTINAAATSNQCTARGCVYFQVPPNTAWVTIQVSGTWSGTLQVYSVTSPNASFQNLNSQTWSLQAQITGNGNWSVANGLSTFVLVQASSFSSGAAQINMTASPDGTPLNNPVFPGTITGTGLEANNGGSSSNCWLTNGSYANCSGSGGGNLSGTLTSGYYPLATGTNTLGNGTIDFGVTGPDLLYIAATKDSSTDIELSAGRDINIGATREIQLTGSDGIVGIDNNGSIYETAGGGGGSLFMDGNLGGATYLEDGGGTVAGPYANHDYVSMSNSNGSTTGELQENFIQKYQLIQLGTKSLFDYNVTNPDQVTLDSTQDASTTFYSVSSGKTDMVAASGSPAELVLGDPVNGTSLTDTSTHGLELISASFMTLISNAGTEIYDNSSSGITIYEGGPSASGSYITLQTTSGPILLQTGTTFQLLVNTAGNAIDFGITTPNVLTLVAPVLTNGATATTQPAGDSSTKIATTAFVISQGTISAGPGLFGASALNTVIAGTKASQAGHFTNLQVIASLGGTCTTPPQFNVFDGTSNVGTAVTATATTQTKGNATVQAQTRTFAAGDQIGIYISTAGATCTTDSFVVTAQYSTP